MPSILNVTQTDLSVFSEGHRHVGNQLNSALDADHSVIAAMPVAYGAVGAPFIAAVDDFESALKETGAALAAAYRTLAEDLDLASASYQRTNQVSEAAIARFPSSITTTDDRDA